MDIRCCLEGILREIADKDDDESWESVLFARPDDDDDDINK